VVLVFILGVTTGRAAFGVERAVVGAEFDYKARRGDTLAAVGARFGVDADSLARQNRLSPKARLRPGAVLSIDNRHIVPSTLENGILINLPQRLLFHFEDGHLVAWYPVGLGQPGSWQTPSGSYKVVRLEENPVWNVPDSIREEMRRKGERVRSRVLPGKDNPLGKHWIGLSLTCCGIHGTIAPRSVYRFESHGCIRLAPQHAKELYSRVAVGTPVEIIYEPVLMARDAYGNVFLEVHPDVYGGSKDQTATAEAIAYGRGLRGASDSPQWRETLQRQEGVAVRLEPENERWGGAANIESGGRGGPSDRAGFVLQDVGPGAGQVRSRFRRPSP
jgi:L,D-transpeptidase ErfK/SrfK